LTNFGTYIPCSLTYETTWRTPDPAPAASEAAPGHQEAEHGARAEAAPPAMEAAEDGPRVTECAPEARQGMPRRTGTLPVYLL
jgi:hypothetical protein